MNPQKKVKHNYAFSCSTHFPIGFKRKRLQGITTETEDVLLEPDLQRDDVAETWPKPRWTDAYDGLRTALLLSSMSGEWRGFAEDDGF